MTGQRTSALAENDLEISRAVQHAHDLDVIFTLAIEDEVVAIVFHGDSSDSGKRRICIFPLPSHQWEIPQSFKSPDGAVPNTSCGVRIKPRNVVADSLQVGSRVGRDNDVHVRRRSFSSGIPSPRSSWRMPSISFSSNSCNELKEKGCFASSLSCAKKNSSPSRTTSSALLYEPAFTRCSTSRSSSGGRLTFIRGTSHKCSGATRRLSP
jgi:hypothetical protein